MGRFCCYLLPRQEGGRRNNPDPSQRKVVTDQCVTLYFHPKSSYAGECRGGVCCGDDEVVPGVDVHQVALHVVVELIVLDLIGHLHDPAQDLAVRDEDLSMANLS